MSWPLVKLGSIGEFKAGYGFPNKYQGETSGDMPFAKVGDISEVARHGGKYISEARNYINIDVLSQIKAKSVPVNTIVFAKIGEAIRQNFRAVTSVETVIDNNSMGLVPNLNLIDVDYLYHFMCKLDLYRYTGATTVPAIRKSTLEDIEIPLPPLEEQKRIAAILDKADAIRRKRQQAIQLADDFLRSVFLDMFGDPVTNPKGWEVKTVIDVSSSKLQNGAYYPKDMYNSAGTEMVHMGDAFYDYVPRGKMKRVLVPDKDLQKYCLTSNDILISRRSLNYEGAAKPSLISESEDNLIFESSLIRLSPDQNIIDRLYLFSYLSNEKVKKHKVRQYVTGATIKGISQKNLEKVNIVLPPLDLQKKYAQIFRKVETLKNSFSYYEQNKLFESLSQKAFAGEL